MDLVERWCESTTELRRVTALVVEDPLNAERHAMNLAGLMAVDQIRAAAVAAHMQSISKTSPGSLLFLPAEGNA